MNLKDAISEFSQPHLTSSNDWYKNSIRCKEIPVEVNISPGTDYEENIQLKEQLHIHYINADNETKKKIIKYYISKWGGINKNSPENINSYTFDDPDIIIAQKRKQGVASWSKALAIREPQKFAIYDSRVSISINCLQIIHNTENKILFPMPNSRDEESNLKSKIIKNYAKQNDWDNADNYYPTYNNLLLSVAKEQEIYFGDLEMLLFSKKEELQSAALAIINSNK